MDRQWSTVEEVQMALAMVAKATQDLLEGLNLTQFVNGMAFTLDGDAIEELQVKAAAAEMTREVEEFLTQ